VLRSRTGILGACEKIPLNIPVRSVSKRRPTGLQASLSIRLFKQFPPLDLCAGAWKKAKNEW
jgi:hypothetical protein